jgi:hypothetical protein
MYSALHVRSTYADAFGSVFRQSSRDGTKWPIPALWPAAGVLEDWKHPFLHADRITCSRQYGYEKKTGNADRIDTNHGKARTAIRVA